MNRAAQAIEDFFQQRYDKDAIFLPSGRLGLFVAFREWLQPGDRLLMSPINDDVVLFTVLAAGLIPVIGPLDARTGNLDPDAVDSATWKSLRGVLTTNLYGIPDRMDRLVQICRTYGLLLVEDACQALDSSFQGTRIGRFSSVAVFSLTKHIAGAGGVLTFSEGDRRRSLVSRAQEEILCSSSPAAIRARFAHALVRLAETTGTAALLRRIKRRLLPPQTRRPGHRMEYSVQHVLNMLEAGGGLGRFDGWVGIDHRAYRMAVRNSDQVSTLRELQNFEQNRQRRLHGTKRLLELGLASPDVPLPQDGALFRVPLFVRNREAVLRSFAARSLHLDYIYDPPLTIYVSPRLAIKLSSRPEAERWSHNVLPVDPLQADKFISLLREIPALVSVANCH